MAYAVYDAGWLLYNQTVAGNPAGSVNTNASCPLGGTVAVAGSTSVDGSGVNGMQLTFTMTSCAVSAASYSLTFTGVLQMSGTFTPMMQDDITFSSSHLSITGPLRVLDDPSVSETCSVSMTDTWNYDPKAVAWLNGSVCGRSADGTASGSASIVPDTKCLLDSMKLTENGQPVELVEVPETALATADGGAAAVDGGVSTPGAAVPEITSAPAAMTFVSGNTQPLDLAFSDPTASRPAFLMTLRPRGDTRQCAFACCFGCRGTHRVFDKLTRGVAHYEATTASDPVAPAAGDLIIYPVSCNEPGVDPIEALTAGGGAACTPVIGAPTTVGTTFAPATAGGGSSGGSGSGSASGGPTGRCTSDSECSSAAICGTNPGEPNNGGICDVAGDGLCHCCYGTCGVDPQTGVTSGCMCLGCASSSDCTQLAYPTCLGGHCITKVGAAP